jgi:GWxTD domain-containing protein
MKHIRLLLLWSLVVISLSVQATVTLNAGFTWSLFRSPDQGAYVETWLSVNAATVQFVEIGPGKFVGEVEVIMIFTSSDTVATFRKYNLRSQVIEDTANRAFGFLDQQRFLLPNGTYELEISLRDINKEEQTLETVTQVVVDIPADQIALSTVMLVDKTTPATKITALTRAGYDLYPDLYQFYPVEKNNITFYCEAYHTLNTWGADGMFLMTARIESFETGTLMNNISFFRRENAAKVVPMLHSFDISKLPSGNYYLVVEVKDRENKQVAINRAFFQRSNPTVQMRLEDITAIDVMLTFSKAYTHRDTLAFFIKSCFPLASELEKMFAENLLKDKNLTHMQQFLYHFWSVRNPTDPQQEWRKYKVQVDRVNLTYGTFIKAGFETDRGIIWLRYGEPNTIYRSTHEPEAYPYEIWHYYRLTNNQSNRKFVFINEGMGAGDFTLAHSNAIGEMNDAQWHLRLHGRQVGGTNVDRTQYNTNYGSRALEIFNNPY